MNTYEKLTSLRQKMNAEGIFSCIIPSGDPHLSEYPTEHWKIREWISGFTGSAGTLVVTMQQAGLWTDSRYYLQASEQLDGNCISLFKEGMPDVPEYTNWLINNVPKGSKIGINNKLFSITKSRELVKTFCENGFIVDENFALAEEIWNTRPSMPDNAITSLPNNITGFSRSEKLEQIREEMKKTGAVHYITGSLDEIAWTLNLRGSDVLFNPVFYCFLVISLDSAKLFINPHKLSTHLAKEIDDDNIKVHLYDRFYTYLKDISADSETVLIDPSRTNMATFNALSRNVIKRESDSIITNLKAIKNETEIANFRQAMIKDGVAMVHFLAWLNRNFEKETITELSAAKKLTGFREEQTGFSGESFATISSYGHHGAIVHYSVTPETDIPLKPGGIYLVDSGGQYTLGTTDITRTIALGEVSEQMKTDYTLVLKGHIALAMAVFPAGTRGVQLDILARKALWEHRLNFGHGTGHGVGYFLNVHEGPQTIRTQDNGVTMKPGMVTSNEPGLYRAGKYGIRIENLILCIEKEETEFGKFLAFETLTLCPLDVKLIKKGLLSDDEINWINEYHKMVYETLSQLILHESLEWLKEAVREI